MRVSLSRETVRIVVLEINDSSSAHGREGRDPASHAKNGPLPASAAGLRLRATAARRPRGEPPSAKRETRRRGPGWQPSRSASPAGGGPSASCWGPGSSINYFDRINLSVAAPQLQEEFGLDRGSSAGSSAASSGPTRCCRSRAAWSSTGSASRGEPALSAFLWALASAMTAFAGGFGGISRGAHAARRRRGARPSRPARRPPATGFPAGERALATAIFDAAAKFSNVIGVPLVALAVVQFGWRWGFGITGMLELRCISSPSGRSTATRAKTRG